MALAWTEFANKYRDLAPHQRALKKAGHDRLGRGINHNIKWHEIEPKGSLAVLQLKT